MQYVVVSLCLCMACVALGKCVASDWLHAHPRALHATELALVAFALATLLASVFI